MLIAIDRLVHPVLALRVNYAVLSTYELLESIHNCDIQTPIKVMKIRKGWFEIFSPRRYVVIDGNHRVRICRFLDRAAIPCEILPGLFTGPVA